MDQGNESTPPPLPQEPGQPVPSTRSIPDTLSVGQVFGDAHDVLKNNYGVILGAIVILFLCALAVAAIGAAIDAMLVGVDAIVQPVSMLLNLFVLSPLYVGPGLLAAMRYRAGRDAGVASGSLETLFVGYTRYPTVLGITVVMALISWAMMITVGLLALAATAAAGPAGGLAVGVLLGLPMYVVLIYVYIRLGYATLLAVDPLGVKPGSIDAIKLSWHLTSGHAWMLFAIGLILGLIIIGTALLLFLPALFYGIPLAMCGGGVMYMVVARDHLSSSGSGPSESTPPLAES